MPRKTRKQPGKPEPSHDPDPDQDQDQDQDGDPTPDIKFRLSNGGYFLGLVYQIHVKAPNDSASAVSPYYKDVGEAENKKEKEVYKPNQKHLIIELIVLSEVTNEEESLFVWMRRSDYYIIGFRSHKKTYHFCDRVNEGIGGTTLEYSSEYGSGLPDPGNVFLGFDEFVRCVTDLIISISDAPKTTTDTTTQNTETTTDTKKKPKAKHTKHTKVKPTKPTSDRNPANSYQKGWQSAILGICVCLAEASRNYELATIIHRNQISSTSMVDYTNEARSSQIPPQLKTKDEIYKFIKGVTKGGYRLPGAKMSKYQSQFVTNWSNASDVGRTYNLAAGKLLYLTAKEEATIRGPDDEDVDDSYKKHLNDKVLTNNKLCYYLTPLKCKEKTKDR